MDSKQDLEKSKASFGLLVEDVHFQEFSAENWTGKDEEDSDVNFGGELRVGQCRRWFEHSIIVLNYLRLTTKSKAREVKVINNTKTNNILVETDTGVGLGQGKDSSRLLTRFTSSSLESIEFTPSDGSQLIRFLR